MPWLEVPSFQETTGIYILEVGGFRQKDHVNSIYYYVEQLHMNCGS
jgi:hypothetical protein